MANKQVAETAERKGADRLLLVIADPDVGQTLAGKDIEMVEPEIDHDLLQLTPAQHGSKDARFAGVPQEHADALAPGLFQLGRKPEAARHADRPVKLAQLTGLSFSVSTWARCQRNSIGSGIDWGSSCSAMYRSMPTVLT